MPRWMSLIVVLAAACDVHAEQPKAKAPVPPAPAAAAAPAQQPVPPAEPPKPEPPAVPKDYELKAAIVPESVSAGQAARYQLTITPHAPWVLKTETPFDVRLSASNGVTLEKAKLTAKDFADPKAEAKVVASGFSAPAGTGHNIVADMSFFLCSQEICKRERDKVSVTFAAK